MDVQGLRDYVRLQLDVDDEELPNTLLDIYLQEAFDRTMAYGGNRWPRNETTWSLTQVAGNDSIAAPTDLNLPAIVSAVSVSNPDVVLTFIAQETAEQMFITNSVTSEGVPGFISIWGGRLYLWPRPPADADYEITIRGYRRPNWDTGSSAIPDLDERLHVTLAYFAIALAYAQQEDEVLEGVYMARWQRDLDSQLKAIMEPVRNQPLIMGGGLGIYGVSGYVINPPVGP